MSHLTECSGLAHLLQAPGVHILLSPLAMGTRHPSALPRPETKSYRQRLPLEEGEFKAVFLVRSLCEGREVVMTARLCCGYLCISKSEFQYHQGSSVHTLGSFVLAFPAALPSLYEEHSRSIFGELPLPPVLTHVVWGTSLPLLALEGCTELRTGQRKHSLSQAQ